MGETHKIELDLPTPPAVPDLQPQLSEVRERLARVEERTINPVVDPAVAEIRSLASEAHQRVVALEALVAKSAADLVPAPVEKEVLDLPPPPPPPATPELEPVIEPESREHPPWYNPLRYL